MFCSQIPSPSIFPVVTWHFTVGLSKVWAGSIPNIARPATTWIFAGEFSRLEGYLFQSDRDRLALSTVYAARLF